MGSMSHTAKGQSKTSAASTIMRTGVVLDKKHPTDPNLYYVHFGSKTANEDGRLDGGIWCNNGLGNFVRYRDQNNQAYSYGSYIPIHPGAPVNVLMTNGGKGNPTIIGFQSTTTSTPDMDNVHDLYILGQSPNGSSVEIDDKVGAIRMVYNKGATVFSLADELATLEITDGHSSGRKANTGIFMRKGGIIFKLKDSMMQFDESGLSINFDDGGTVVKITKKRVVMEGMEVFKVASKEQVSLKGTKMTLEGTKDASLTASELKVGGKQLTNITGSQINIESMFAISLKSLAINFWAWTKLSEFSATKDSNILMAENKTLGTYSEASGIHSVTTGAFNIGAGSINMDWNISNNSGIGMSAAASQYSSTKASMVAIQAALTTLGTTMLLKVAPIAAANKIIADTLAGASEPAQEPSGNASNARDKNDKKSYGSVAATKFSKNKYVMEKYSITPNLISFTVEGSSTAIPYVIPGDTTMYIPKESDNFRSQSKPKTKSYSKIINKLLK